MGCSICSIRESKNPTQEPDQLCYRQSKMLQMGSISAISMGISDKFFLEFSEPTHNYYETIQTKDFKYKISGCVIPGWLPGQREPKICQDICFYYISDELKLFALFDGHGEYGHHVVNCCKQYLEQNIRQQKLKVPSNPMEYLKQVTSQLQNCLQQSHINIEFSGTTQVLVLIIGSTIYSANLGDSRAGIIAQEIKKGVNTNKLKFLQITKDHKPNLKQEKKRIVLAQGKVSKGPGRYFGPYRVWNKNFSAPGLAMSRSLGDRYAHTLGVSSHPTIKQNTFNENTKFIVLASDGIWEFMENFEVAEFIEKYRFACTDNPQGDVEIVEPRNSHIARLLCEEARTRWISNVESSGSHIDDMSCLIMEIFSEKGEGVKRRGRCSSVMDVKASDVSELNRSMPLI